ncbi:MAG: Verru_Chthon cassette protein A, partial [Verrucomicrobiales bacterium]|nr:Verru_Chthon cassette protein A [Verrucomicrobiales bacterium]
VNLTTTPLPGFGGTFELKYSPHDNRQILTSIYDYIRTTNLRDRSNGRLNPFAPNGIVYPTQIDFEGGSTAGLGRFETVSEFGYLIHQASEPRRRSVKNAAGENVTITERDIRAAFLWETVCLAQGLVGYRQNHIVKIEGLDQLRLDAENGQDFYINGKLASQIRSENPDAPPGISLSLPNSVEMTLNAPATSAPESHPWGGTLSPALNMLYNTRTSPADTADIRVFGEEGETGYPLVSSSSVRIGTAVDAEISLRDVRLKFSGTTITFNFFSNDDEETPLGSYSFELPPVGELPLPLIRRGATPRSSQFRLNSRLALGFNSGAKNSASGLPWHDLIQPTDIVRTVQPAGRSPGSNVGPSGDLRHLAVLSMTNENGLPSQAFHPRIDFDDTNPSPLPFDSPDPQTRFRCLHSFSTNGGLYFPMQNDAAAFGSLLKGAKADYHHGTTEELIYYQAPGRIPDNLLTTRRPNFSDNIDGARLSNGLPGDWDTGTGFTSDGPFVNKLDDGTVLLPATLDTYFYGTPQENTLEPGQYHPNRMVTSAASFGSLPTGIHRGKPWETLLFNPGPASGNDHPSLHSGPPDHLFLEFFHMPVVSPYSLSTPAATAGRVNINTQIAPFTHIHRDTALYAALAAHRVTVVPRREAASYKTATDPSTASNDNYRLPLDLDLTVEGIRRRFAQGKIFRTASQICEEFLVPASLSGTRMFEEYDREKLVALWSNPSRSGLSGDNVREAPYAHLYPKITARSNSFTVHVRAQVITKVRSSLPTAFDPKRDRVDGEWRGSFGLRRQLDPTDDRIPDYAVKTLSSLGSANGEPTLDELHQIHITNVRRFNPRPTKDYQ